MTDRLHVLMSYDHRDEEWALEFRTELENQGIDVWMDREHLDPSLSGIPLAREILHASQATDLTVAIVSDVDRESESRWRSSLTARGYSDGDWVQHEKVIAHGRVFIVAHGGEIAQRQLDATSVDVMGNAHVGDISGERAARQLADEIRALAEQESPPPHSLLEAILREPQIMELLYGVGPFDGAVRRFLHRWLVGE